MSSLRNAINRRTHKERAQPLERKRFGLLEKHKDYSLRAADYNKKKKTLSNLRAKAAEKNDDEFSYKMLSRSGPGSAILRGKKWTGTVDGDRGNRPLDMDTVRLLKTQDIATLRMYRSTAVKEVARLEERVVGLGGTLVDVKRIQNDDDDDDDDDEEWADEGPSRKKPRKIVFADGVEEREQMLVDEVEKEVDDEDQEDGNDDAVSGDKENPEKLRAEQRQQLLLKLQRRLANARKKLRTVTKAENELDLQRARMAKTPTVGGVTKSGKKFKVRERKR